MLASNEEVKPCHKETEQAQREKGREQDGKWAAAQEQRKQAKHSMQERLDRDASMAEDAVVDLAREVFAGNKGGGLHKTKTARTAKRQTLCLTNIVSD